MFAAFADQLRRHYESGVRQWLARKVGLNFSPENFGDWFYHRIAEWSRTQLDSAACVHVFRKTGLQHAVDGEAENKKVAQDARLSVRVMTNHYTSEREQQFREKSNRTFHRIANNLPQHVLLRYSYAPQASISLADELEKAIQNQNLPEIPRLLDELKRRG